MNDQPPSVSHTSVGYHLALVLDRDGIVRFESPAFGEILGYAKRSHTGRRLMEFVHPEDAGALRQLIHNTIDGGPDRNARRLRIRHGSAGWWVVEAEALSLADGEDGAGVLMTLREIGEEIRAAAAISRAREGLRRRLSRYPALVRHFDLDGVCTECNWPWREFTGGAVSEEEGVSDWMAPIHPSDRQLQVEAIHQAIATRKPFELEYRLKDQTGEYRWIREIVLPAFDPGGALLSYIGIGFDLSASAAEDSAARRSQTQLRALNARLHRTREEERIRISREIHDVLGQELTALRFEASAIRRDLDPSSHGQLAKRLAAMEADIDASIVSLQRFVSELRPRVLDDFGLQAAIDWVMADFARRVRIACDHSLSGELHHLSLAQETAIFRILQEATTNVARHARAKRVQVELEVRDASLRLEVVDDGIGVEAACLQDPKSLGLVGMRERAREIGGWLSIESLPAGGTRVRLDAPMDQRLPRTKDGSATRPSGQGPIPSSAAG